MGRDVRDITTDNSPDGTAAWTTSNVTVDRSIDANGATAELGDGLTTLINDLKAQGILQ